MKQKYFSILENLKEGEAKQAEPNDKVLLIDDISSQFTGIVTSTGGGVIGTTNFDLFTNGESLFHKTFDPTTGINTSTDSLTI